MDEAATGQHARSGAGSKAAAGAAHAYSRSQVARLFNLSPSRLRSWERARLVEPSVRMDSRPAFDFRDLVCVRRVLSLLDDGVPLRRIGAVVRELRHRHPELERPTGLLGVWGGARRAPAARRLAARHDGVWIEAGGQLLLDLDRGEGSDPVVPFARPDDSRALDDAVAWFELGCQKDSDPRTLDEAIEAYRRAIELAPEFADAHCNLGAVLYNSGHRGKARACFERALAIDDGHLESNLNLANVLEELDLDQLALEHYRAAMKADPSRADVQLNLALLYEKLGLRWKAKPHWRRYLQAEPHGGWAEVARGRLAEPLTTQR